MKDEALKLALEALELHGKQYPHMVKGYCLDAITAIKQAFAAPVQEPVGCEGAIVNGRVYADRLEQYYKFECEAGPLHLCNDWVEFRRCFEWLATHTTPPAAPDLQAELEATNRQVEILSDALAESRREIDAMIALARADERNRTWTQEHWTEYERSIAAQEREACAKTRAGKPRELKPIGRGMLLDEQQFCFDRGWREGAASVRAAIRARSCPPCNEDCDQGRNCPARKDK